LPTRRVLEELIEQAYELYREVKTGSVSTVYPALGRADPDLFGISLVGTNGNVLEVGDARTDFTIMSVAKPFVFALMGQHLGVDAVRQVVSLNATGLPFNSVTAIERATGGRTNPMVNSGALATTSLAPGRSLADRWEFLQTGLSLFAGRTLKLDQPTLKSAQATNHRNRAIAALLDSFGVLGQDPADTAELYTRQSCLAVDCVDLATMGATLADGGVNPVTGVQVIDAEVARVTLAVMTVAGLYETSGDWLVDVGVPGKSGISGGIVTISPGKGALGTFAPPLDPAGNSVRGQLVARFLSRRLGLDILASSKAEHEAV
jgi:glutaminase